MLLLFEILLTTASVSLRFSMEMWNTPLALNVRLSLILPPFFLGVMPSSEGVTAAASPRPLLVSHLPLTLEEMEKEGENII